MAIVYVLMTGLVLFSDLGISQAIIQNRRGEDPDFLNTAWTVQIVRGIFIWLLALGFASALPLAVSLNWVASGTVYANPLLPWIWGVFSLTALIQGFESTKIALAQRKLQIKAITQIELFSQMAALVVMVVWASLYHSIWALVGGAFVSATVRCVMGHIWLPGEINKFRWDSDSAKEILHFGKWIFLLSIIGFLVNSGDRIVLGGFLDPVQMGLYSVAFLLSNAFAELFTSMLSRIVFPAVSEVVRERPENLAKVYHHLQMIADLCLFGAAGFLFVVGEGVVQLLYDQRYHAAGPMLTVLALGLIAGRYTLVYQFCLAMGSMRYLFAAAMVRLVALYAGIPLGFSLAGIEGAVMAIVVSQFTGWPVAVYFKAQHGLIDWKRELIGLPMFGLAAVVGWGFLQALH
ncbi:MAG: oligosaccharide flippase family protein [Gammaproteobacteria bacterium]|nr:oligosaccharide flippase family protein [Gammaproteobacteria bacterium]MBU1978205.1 oligosaccharide flippase family protein [Gammaproteobacteria bacterium]